MASEKQAGIGGFPEESLTVGYNSDHREHSRWRKLCKDARTREGEVVRQETQTGLHRSWEGQLSAGQKGLGHLHHLQEL